MISIIAKMNNCFVYKKNTPLLLIMKIMVYNQMIRLKTLCKNIILPLYNDKLCDQKDRSLSHNYSTTTLLHKERSGRGQSPKNIFAITQSFRSWLYFIAPSFSKVIIITRVVTHKVKEINHLSTTMIAFSSLQNFMSL